MSRVKISRGRGNRCDCTLVMPQDKSKHVITYMASAAPEDTHLGVPISLLGSTLSYDHHVCHPRNGEGWGEEGQSRAARAWASREDINREERGVGLPPSLQK